MVNLSLVANGGDYGWAVASRNIAAQIARKTPARLLSAPVVKSLEHLVPAGWDPRYPRAFDGPMLHAIEGASLRPVNLNVWSTTRNVGYCFIEYLTEAEKFVANAGRYFDRVVAGSTWAASALEKIGLRSVGVAIQGIDATIFYPRETLKDPGRFIIVSAGKAEHRKGQDLVLAAFKRIMHEIPQAHLLCAWASPWPQLMDSLAQSPHISYPAGTHPDWTAKTAAMMNLNGIDPGRYTLVPALSHAAMADVYRRSDLGIFLSRCEAGTNLPLMECMACGVPAIVSDGTGHADVLFDRSLVVSEGRRDAHGWFEADVSRVAETIRRAYRERAQLPAAGSRASAWIREQFTWEKTAGQLIAACTLV